MAIKSTILLLYQSTSPFDSNCSDGMGECRSLSLIIHVRTRVRMLRRVLFSGSEMLLSASFAIPATITLALFRVRIRLLP